MPWVARILPILVRVIGRGSRIGAKRGVGGIGKNLPKVLDKVRRADGWKGSALSKFSNDNYCYGFRLGRFERRCCRRCQRAL